jgi:DNA-binding transcriptional LysR family regulator
LRAVVEHGKFSLAAAALDIAQASVSAHIKSLEAQVGQPLFIRGPGRAPKLTEAGKMIYAYALDVLKRHSEASAGLRALDTQRASIVVAAPHFASKRLPFSLAAFAADHPNVKLVIRRVPGNEVISLLRSGNVDLGMVYAHEPIPGIESGVAWQEEMVLVASPHHPLALRPVVAVEDLADQPFIAALSGSSFAINAENVLRALGVEHFEVVMEAEDPATMQGLVAEGIGIACCMRACVEEELRDGRLAALRVDRTIPALPVHWAHPAQQPLSKGALDLLEHLRTLTAH